MESKRQKQVAKLIHEVVSDIFRQNNTLYFGKEIVTITYVIVTKDLSIARSYLGVYNVADTKAVLDSLSYHNKIIRKELAAKIRHRVRKIPEIEFYIDDTIDKALRLEEIFNQIKDPSSKK